MLRPGFEVLAELEPGAVAIDYANARDLAARIVAGDDVDVFASASPNHPRELRRAGLAGGPSQFASNHLVVAVAADSAASAHGVLAQAGTRVVIEVEGIPLGDYTRELFRRVDAIDGGGFTERVTENVVREVQTVFEVADALLSGEADAAVLYATDVAAHPGLLRAIELPREASVAVTCVACVVESSARRADAVDWVAALVGPDVQAVLRRAGFGPPPAA